MTNETLIEKMVKSFRDETAKLMAETAAFKTSCDALAQQIAGAT